MRFKITKKEIQNIFQVYGIVLGVLIISMAATVIDQKLNHTYYSWSDAFIFLIIGYLILVFTFKYHLIVKNHKWYEDIKR